MIRLKARIRLCQRERRKRKKSNAYVRKVRRRYSEGGNRGGDGEMLGFYIVAGVFYMIPLPS